MKSFHLFLLTFLSLYGLMHAYAYFKLRFIIPWKRPLAYVVALILLLLLLSPMLGRLLAAKGINGWASMILFVGYEWMALLFLFTSANMVLDAIHLLVFLGQRFIPGMGLSGARKKTAALALSVAVVGAFVYGHFEARDMRVNRLDLISSKLPTHANPLRIVQVSDLHFSSINGEKAARRVAGRIESLEPDIIVSTGDLLDRGMKDSEKIAGVFRSLNAPLGKYAVTGNHEVYHGVETSVRFLEEAGFRVLRGEAVTPAPHVSILGVDDEAIHRVGGPKGKTLEELLRGVPAENLVLYLCHRPLVSEAALGRVDLQLSGHTHGGQIFPFNLVVSMAYPYLRGSYELKKGTVLHVNRGTGTWGPPVRVGSPPEITLVTFTTGTGGS